MASDMGVKRPRRSEYKSEPDYLNACLRYLDAKYPEREEQRKRVAAWMRWEMETDERLRARIGELILADDLTDAEDDELDRLTDEWKARRRRGRDYYLSERRTNHD